jgi:hypothetical protein
MGLTNEEHNLLVDGLLLCSFCLKEGFNFDQATTWLTLAEKMFMTATFENPSSTREDVALAFTGLVRIRLLLM